ncbi:uncharacterized protein LOC144712123 isoform X1 [Wolffia australiana]
MAGDKSSWILEFLLRQPLEDWLVKEILFRLAKPACFDNPQLKRVLFLRQLSYDLSARRYSEITLMNLELLEELDRSLCGTATYDALRTAYCAVAAEVTVSSLRDGSVSEFRSMADRVWCRRVGDLERSEARGLVGRSLRGWKKLFEEATGDDEWKGRVLRQETAQEAATALGNYLKLAFQDMGPPLLERMARRVASDPREFRSHWAEKRVGEETGELVGSAELTSKSHPPHTSADDDGGSAPVQRGVTIPMEMAERPGPTDEGKTFGYPVIPSMEVEVVKEALKSSCADLERAVRDPLPEALQKASAVQATAMEKGDGSNDLERERPVIPSVLLPSVDGHAHEIPANEMYEDKRDEKEKAAAPRPRLLERNPTAHTVEWSEDSEELISEKTTYSSRRLRLPSPRIGRVSPLKRHNDLKFARRRKMKKWTTEEEEALRKAVEKHGSGQWKFILQRHPEVFEERTEVDLKDKWRNMCRYRL